jgi:hypothetical protein
MKPILLVTLLLTLTCNAWGWGLTGHRVIAGIAEQRLNDQGKKMVKELLGDSTLPEVSNYMDFIKSSDSYKYLETYHYVNIPDEGTYDTAQRNPHGDVVKAICFYYNKLRSTKRSRSERQQALKFLTHLVGDIHQPLHARKKEDMGGLLVKVKWFGKTTDLHKMWDEEIIDSQKLSYTEYISFIYKPVPEIAEWEKATLLDYINEDMVAITQIYSNLDSYKFKKSYSLSYRYIYDNLELVNKRLLQAGVRLAVLINQAAEGRENPECKEITKKFGEL